MIKRFVTWGMVFAMVALVGITIPAQEIKVTTSPNPVRPGGKIRVTLQSATSLNQPAVVVNGNRITLSKVTATLYTASIDVPVTSRLGMVSGSIKFLATTGKELSIPFQYEVSSQAAESGKAVQSRAGEGG
ncbi:hypothetical protein EBR57_10610, partial [bacterium]|nr:hypothetical protein [bacterium]